MACKKHQPGKPCCGCTLCGKCIASYSLLDCVPLTFAWPVVEEEDSCGPFGATLEDTGPFPYGNSERHSGCTHVFSYCNEETTTTNYTYDDDCTARTCGPNASYTGYRKTHDLDLTVTNSTKVIVEVREEPTQVVYTVRIYQRTFVSYVDTVTTIPLTITCASGPGGTRVLTVTEGEATTTTNSSGYLGNSGATSDPNYMCSSDQEGRSVYNYRLQEYILTETKDCETVCEEKTLTRFQNLSGGQASLRLPGSVPPGDFSGCLVAAAMPLVSLPVPAACSTTVRVQLDCLGA